MDVLIGIGDDLWPSAAKILATAPIPADWMADSGLRAHDHPVIASAVAALFAQTLPLLHIVSRANAGIEPDAEELRALLDGIAPGGSLPLAMMIALAIAMLPLPEPFVRVADAFVGRQDDPIVRATSDRAVDFVLNGIEQSSLTGVDLVLAAPVV
jgi:hypothetical protein